MKVIRIMTASVIQYNGPEAGFREYGNEQSHSIKTRNLFIIERLLASVPFFLQQIA
jgi:hypothetical protein